MVREQFTRIFALFALLALLAFTGGSASALPGGTALSPQAALGDDDTGEGDDDDKGDDKEKKNEEDDKRDRGNEKADKVAATRVITVAPACTFDAVADQTTCTLTADLGASGAAARRIIVPEEVLCADQRTTSPALLIGSPGTITGDDDSSGDDGNSRDDDDSGSGNSDENTGAPPGAATLTLAGNVSPGGLATTYYVETDSGLFPARGLGLVCAPADAAAPLPTATLESDINDSTGAIMVLAFDCGQVADTTNFDWFGGCAPAPAPGQLELSQWDGATFVAVGAAKTGTTGELSFPQLAPGRYELHEPATTWCHAESDSVNAQGEVMVAAGQRSTVWVFHCAPPATLTLLTPTPAK